MALRFTPEALLDLSEADQYLSGRSPQGLANVLASLKRTFANIESNIYYGRPLRGDSVRLAVEPRYDYLIPYYLKGGDIWILRVYHSRRPPLGYAAIELP